MEFTYLAFSINFTILIQFLANLSKAMKYWLSQLPLEVWVDCYRYPGITRQQLGQIVDLIGNYKYGEYLQFYLHDWGKRTLKPIYFIQPLIKAIPLTPMPSNIRSFESIQINHFDQQTIDFLQLIRPLLLADIKLEFNGIQPWNLDTLRAILDHMVPLLGGIDSLKCNMLALPIVQQCLGNEKLTKINWIKAFDLEYEGMDEAMTQATINVLMTWLTQPAQQNSIVEPKWCDMKLWKDNGFSEQICAAIREDFLTAKSPSTYAFFVYSFHSQWEFAEFHPQNSIGEELHGVRIGRNSFRITRHPANCDTEMEEWIEQIKAKSSNVHFQSQIEIISPKIGHFDAMDVPDNVEENEEKASTSKEA